MFQDLTILTMTAASIGFLHTLLGPDHYIPFVVMAKARRWSILKTLRVTLACGAGHVVGSVLLGISGIFLGIAATQLEAVESFRGDVAAWLLIAFGFAYFIWGLKRAVRSKPHTHIHDHGDGKAHRHIHTHEKGHIHVHGSGTKSITPWVLFTIFILGPCEPLIPLLMYPAAKNNLPGILQVSLVFGISTLITMLAAVFILMLGVERLHLDKAERFSPSLAGRAVCLSGLAIVFLGL